MLSRFSKIRVSVNCSLQLKIG